MDCSKRNFVIVIEAKKCDTENLRLPGILSTLQKTAYACRTNTKILHAQISNLQYLLIRAIDTGFSRKIIGYRATVNMQLFASDGNT
jgi:hypothetical protein